MYVGQLEGERGIAPLLSKQESANPRILSVDVNLPPIAMIIGVPIVAMLLAMLTVRADEVGGLPLAHDRYRKFQSGPGGGGWAPGPGWYGPGVPGGTSTSKKPTTSNPGGSGPDGGSGPIDSSGDPSGSKGETPTGATPQHDYYKKWRLEEELGSRLYAGNSPPNTVYDYPRVEAVLQTHVPTRIRKLICYVEECSDEYLKLENSTLYTYTRVYLRDIRPESAVHVQNIDSTSAVIFFDSNENKNNSDIDLPYLESRELVWNIQFDAPKNIRIRISTINLEDADSNTEDCPKDYLILYDPDTPDPTMFCTNDTNPSIQPYDNITNFIIKFVSDEDITFPRGFQGRIIVLNNISAQSSQMKRSVRSTEKKKKDKEEKEEEEEEEEEKNKEEEEEKKKEEKEEKEEEVEGERVGMLGAVTEQSESELQAHIKMFEICVDEMLDFGEEAAFKYAEHPVCGPASKSYFHYLLDSCIRQN